jgi:hypothetical protein
VTARKLAELWEVDGGYHLRVVVGAFQPSLTDDPAAAEQYASYEAIEVLRKIVADSDANRVEYRADSELPPPEARR